MSQEFTVFLLDDKGNRFDLPTTTKTIAENTFEISGHLTDEQFTKLSKSIYREGQAQLRSFSLTLRTIIEEGKQ